MLTSKKVFRVLFGGKSEVFKTENSKTITFNYSSGNSNFNNKSFTWRTDDGFIQAILEKIESLENEVNELKVKQITCSTPITSKPTKK